MRIILLSMGSLLLFNGATQIAAQVPDDLADAKEFRAFRIASTDPKFKNADFRRIEPGQKARHAIARPQPFDVGGFRPHPGPLQSLQKHLAAARCLCRRVGPGGCAGGCTNSILLPSGSSTSNQWLPSRPCVTCFGNALPCEARYLRSPSASVVTKAT